MRTFLTCDPIPKGKFYHILPIKSRWAENSEVTKVDSKLGSEKNNKKNKKLFKIKINLRDFGNV